MVITFTDASMYAASMAQRNGYKRQFRIGGSDTLHLRDEHGSGLKPIFPDQDWFGLQFFSSPIFWPHPIFWACMCVAKNILPSMAKALLGLFCYSNYILLFIYTVTLSSYY